MVAIGPEGIAARARYLPYEARETGVETWITCMCWQAENTLQKDCELVRA
jgi:hypothetical protein